MYYRNWTYCYELQDWAYCIFQWKEGKYTLGEELFVNDMRLQELITSYDDDTGMYIECAFDNIPMLYETKEEAELVKN